MSGQGEKWMPKLLVVEDDTALREEICRVLERRTKYEFETAGDAEAAIALFSERKFDMVITDVRMPGMSGIDMLEELKAIVPDLVSVIITAFADEQATIKALRIGANDYIRKPFSIRDLLAAIERQVTIIELRRSSTRQRRFLSGMVTNLVSGVLAMDINDSIIAINAKACEALTLPSDQLSEYTTYSALANRLPEENILAEVISDLEISGADYIERDEKVIQSGGLTIPYRVSALALYTEERERLGTVVMFNDISTVVQQQKLNAWKDLARTVAHEIKNPLTPVILGAQQLKTARTMGTETLLKQFDRAIDNIIRNAERLNNLAREFSRFGRLPNKTKERLKLSRLIQTALNTFSERFESQNIDISIQQETENDHMMGDSESLLRMLENLIGNACDVMPTGGKLHISLTEPDSGWLELSVVDSGGGIEPEIMDSLFKPYVTSKENGTGLGLVVVKEVVDRHDGRIEVESTSAGASFKIKLPKLVESID
jgi:two-component system nitrogen regulation sensor histidine kinase NtrY